MYKWFDRIKGVSSKAGIVPLELGRIAREQFSVGVFSDLSHILRDLL